MEFRQELDHVAINALLAGPDSRVTRDLLRRGVRVQQAAKRKVKADHGRLRGSITVTTVRTNGATGPVTAVEVGTNVKYAMMVHNGTGVYGPTGTPIRPKNGRLLVWSVGSQVQKFRYQGSTYHRTFRGQVQRGRQIFARSVKGQPANPFLRDALRQFTRG